MTITPKVRIALLGSGIFATNYYLPVLLQSSEIQLEALWSRSNKSSQAILNVANRAGAFPSALFGSKGIDEIFSSSEIDAIIMALPISAQPELIVRAWSAGKHVLSEKPVAKDVKSALSLINTYESQFKDKGLLWRVAENFAHEPILHRTAEILKSPALGGVLYWQERQELNVIDGSPWHATSWRTVPDYQGGFILDGGVHMTALLRLVLPDPPTKIISTASLHHSHLAPHNIVMGIALPGPSAHREPHGPKGQLDAIKATGIIPGPIGDSSPSGTIVLSWAKPNIPSPDNIPGYSLDITCLNGTVSIQMFGSRFVVKITGALGNDVRDEVIDQESEGVRLEVDMFARAVKGENAEPNHGEPRDALWDLAAIEALLTSRGQPVSLSRLVEQR